MNLDDDVKITNQTPMAVCANGQIAPSATTLSVFIVWVTSTGTSFSSIGLLVSLAYARASQRTKFSFVVFICLYFECVIASFASQIKSAYGIIRQRFRANQLRFELIRANTRAEIMDFNF